MLDGGHGGKCTHLIDRKWNIKAVMWPLRMDRRENGRSNLNFSSGPLAPERSLVQEEDIVAGRRIAPGVPQTDEREYWRSFENIKRFEQALSSTEVSCDLPLGDS